VANHGLHGIALALTEEIEDAEAEERWCEESDRSDVFGVNKSRQGAILSHLDQKEEATNLVRQALQEGWSFWGLTGNFVLKPLWGYEPYEQLIAPKG